MVLPHLLCWATAGARRVCAEGFKFFVCSSHSTSIGTETMKQALRKMSICAVALPFLVLSIPAQAVMTGAQIKAAASGKTFAYSGPDSGTMGLRANGTAWVKDSSGWSSTGKWWVSGNNFCRYWKGKSSRCSSWTSLGGGKYSTGNGYTLRRK